MDHISKLRQILTSTPAALRAMLAGLDESLVHANCGEKTFSPCDVVAHLIHGERTDWIPRVRTILEHGEAKPFTPFDHAGQFEATKGKTPAELLDTFETLRKQNLTTLEAINITPDQLTLRGTHPALGTVTLGELLTTWAVHDVNHIAQIARTLAFQFRNGVGPWGQYLSILP